MTSSANPTPKAEETYHLGNYVVCIIDLLGQKDKLKGWEILPADGQVTPEFSSALKATIGAVQGFHEAFAKFFEAQRMDTRFTEINLSLMNSTDRDLYRRQKDFTLGVTQFSDTFVFYAPLGNSRGELSALPVYAILGACSMAMLLSLAAKLPLRGAIHIGPGLKLPELSFYGPALAEAHRLEATVAQYPRIVVSPTLAAFVQHTPESTGSQFIDGLFTKMLKRCCDMLVVDGFDGQPIVDWLGEGSRKTMGATNDPQTLKALNAAHEFVGQTAQLLQKRFEESNSPNDEKLCHRYFALYQYLLARLPEWGIKFDDTGSNDPTELPNV